MTRVAATFHESTADQRVESLPLSHLSIELGHLYMEDFAEGPDRLAELFHRIAPWAGQASASCAEALVERTPRVSTCFLIDDYFARFSSPRQVLPMLLEAAGAEELEIDYIARESGCAVADGVPLAEIVLGRLVDEPPPGTDGSRPPTTETGWLCNGARTPSQPAQEAMSPSLEWLPPVESAAKRHSIFTDVELWDDRGSTRQWSCPYLAAVWQLLRLGLLRDQGQPVVTPKRIEPPFPDSWDDLPAIAQLRPRAAPFAAYRSFSALGSRFLPIENAVRVILTQVAVERAVAEQVHARAAAEQLVLPEQIIERIEYAFIGPSWR
jgi:hypothetical protein